MRIKDFSVEKFRGQPCQQVLALRFGTPQDAEALFKLQCRVHREMPEPEWFVPAAFDQLQAQLEKGMFLTLWAGEEPVAYLSLLCCGRDEENYAFDLGLPRAQWNSWGNIDSVLVAPEYRGNGIQKRLLKETELCRPGHITAFGTTVSPDNIYSAAAMRAFGFETVCEKEMYGGHLRMLMTKQLAPLPGVYRHFKGGRYRVEGIASHSETLEPMVVYRALYGAGGLWVRPAGMWNEWVSRPEYEGPRFIFESLT